MSARRDKLVVLRLTPDGDAFSWQEAEGLWSAVELTDKTNLFSKVGVGVKSVKVNTVPRTDVSLYDALRWKGKHLFLTAITVINPARMEVIAALIEPTGCAATRPETVGRDERGKPIRVQRPVCSFPACVTEKYLGFVQKEPQGVVEHRLVLVTPKAVKLKTGDLVTVGALGAYAVRVCYALDEYKNEYEVAAIKEA